MRLNLHIQKFLFIIFLFMVGRIHVVAQDLRYSQFFNSPLSTNPANTGFLPSSDYRLGAHYREQWASVPVPYKTMSVYGDFQVMRNLIPSGWIGVGGLILQDQAGSGGLRSTKAYASVAYHQMIGTSSLLSAGFNLGYATKSIKPELLVFGDMWDGKFFTRPTTEVLLNNSIGYFDLQAGLNYSFFPTDNLYFHGGFSMHHLNRPTESFFQQNNGLDNRVPVRSIAFLDAMVKVNDRVIVSPGVYFTNQGNANEFVGGFHLNYNLSGTGKQQLIAGVYARPGDAIIPMLGYQWRSFKFTFSYDATTSGLQSFNDGRGATEMYLQYDAMYKLVYTNKQTICPVF
jgi:type IX secretion system PorP/SprF family membrane protein